ncbi:hypothetical protein D3C81_1975370 [compost metagenome]
MAHSVSPLTTVCHCDSVDSTLTDILSSTLSTPSTLPAHRMIFSRVAWSGATPNTVTSPCEPSTCTISPVASRPIFLM